jgi:lipoate---protein ligase
MMPRDTFERRTSVNLVSKALNNLGIPSKVNCRYDIVIDDKKVSGSAYKLSGKSAYHHGTMLISTDLDILKNNLTPKKSDLIEGGGVDSVRSAVTRLRDYHPSVTHDMFMAKKRLLKWIRIICNLIVPKYLIEP